MSFANKVIAYHQQLTGQWKLPKGFELIYPFDNPETLQALSRFYIRFFDDSHLRTMLFGINPGRLGAGITGIPFTDPKILAQVCGIDNPWKQRHELSASFIYEMIAAMGGCETFYRQFYISAICPLGFIRDGKNINYYDDPQLLKAVEPHIIDHIQQQITFGVNRKVAFSIGQGKNQKYFEALNHKHHFFESIIPLPHPRWVLQYRRKRKIEYIEEYVSKLTAEAPAN